MSNDHTKERESFRDRLVAVEAHTPEFQSHLQQELRAMFIRELNTPSRIIVGVVAVLVLCGAVLSGFLALTVTNLPTLARVGLGVGTLFGLISAIMVAKIFRRGTMDLRVDNIQIAAIVWVFTVLMMVFFLMIGMSIEDRLLGLMMIATGLTFLIGAAVGLLGTRIEQSEMTTREKLLQIELMLAQLCENQHASGNGQTSV